MNERQKATVIPFYLYKSIHLVSITATKGFHQHAGPYRCSSSYSFQDVVSFAAAEAGSTKTKK
jgi:hypothetical protein